MRDLLAAYERLSAGRMQVGRAVVTSVWGSAPRPEGAAMLGHQGCSGGGVGLRWMRGSGDGG